MLRIKHIIQLFITLFLLSCGDAETPDISFFLSKEWKMTSVYINGVEQDIDLSAYRLKLNKDLTYTRTNLNDEVDEGTWTLANGDNQIEITSNLGMEEYLIVELQFRLLELQVIQRSDKVGSTEFRYVLEPIRP